MVCVEVCNDLKPSTERDDLSLDVFLQDAVESTKKSLNTCSGIVETFTTHAMSRIPTSW